MKKPLNPLKGTLSESMSKVINNIGHVIAQIKSVLSKSPLGDLGANYSVLGANNSITAKKQQLKGDCINHV